MDTEKKTSGILWTLSTNVVYFSYFMKPFETNATSTGKICQKSWTKNRLIIVSLHGISHFSHFIKSFKITNETVEIPDGYWARSLDNVNANFAWFWKTKRK